MNNKVGEVEFWKIMVGVGVFFIISLIIFLSLDISLTTTNDIRATALDDTVIFLGEGELCGVLNSECKTGLICEKTEGFEQNGGVCVKVGIDGPFDPRPE